MVAACSGLDVLCHAVESLTALPYSQRPVPESPAARPAYQGANPISDIWASKAIEMVARNLIPAIEDPSNDEARGQMMLAAAFAGIGFGNAGVHVPHAMAYAVAGRVKDYRPAGYPQDAPMVPHGFAVAVSAPAAFRMLAPTAPFRHLDAARLLTGDTAGAGPTEAGDVLAETIARLMRDIGAPNGIGGVGYTPADVPDLVRGAAPQRRLLDNAPSPVHEAELEAIFRDALRCW
jgi:alcohol dehydrogenase class IV